jgi:NDP-sugar pyrophosphorylase family protein
MSLKPIDKAVVLAAGRGTRMQQLTEDIPKPMVEVRGRPILDFIVEGLRDNGVSNILMVVGYKEEVIRQHFADGMNRGVAVSYVTQQTQDGTGRVVELARDFAGDDGFILSYGDILVPPSSYAGLVNLRDDEAVLSIRRAPEEEVSKGGAVFVENGYVTDLVEKPQPPQPTSCFYNAGIYAFRPSVFDYTARLELSPRGEYELTDAIRAMALDGLKIRAVELLDDWVDVRDPEVLQRLNKA